MYIKILIVLDGVYFWMVSINYLKQFFYYVPLLILKNIHVLCVV